GDLGEDVVGVEARIRRARREEAQEGLDVRRVVRPRGDVGRRLLFPGPVARGVTDRAVVGDAGEADDLFREADGQLPALLPEDAERAVAARSRRAVEAPSDDQNVFRYSISASFSADDSSVP